MSEVTLKSHHEGSHFRLACAETKEVEKVAISVGKVPLNSPGWFLKITNDKEA